MRCGQTIVPGQRSGEDWTRRGAQGVPAAQCYPDNRVQHVSAQSTNPGSGQPQSQDQTIEYDAWGNVRRILTTSGPQQGQTLDLLYDGLHQLRASRLFEPGPATAPQGHTIPSSALQRNGQTGGQGSGQFTITYYDYDALGRRIGKTSFTQTSAQAATTAQRSWYGWDGDRLVSTETHTPEGRERVCTVYEPQSFVPLLRFAWVRQDEGGADGKAKRDPQLLHYHCNHLGTPEALIDRQGQIVWQAEFDPWGNLRSEFNPQQIDQPIRMQGQQLDLETGLFYNRYRYYDPGTGRYVTQDPIGLAGGLNASLYPTNPLLLVDPFGLDPQRIRIDLPHNGQTGQQTHAHVYENGKEVRVVNKDGTQSHGAKKNTGKLTEKTKEFLRKKGFNLGVCDPFLIWDVVKGVAREMCQRGDVISCSIYKDMGGEVIEIGGEMS